MVYGIVYWTGNAVISAFLCVTLVETFRGKAANLPGQLFLWPMLLGILLSGWTLIWKYVNGIAILGDYGQEERIWELVEALLPGIVWPIVFGSIVSIIVYSARKKKTYKIKIKT